VRGFKGWQTLCSFRCIRHDEGDARGAWFFLADSIYWVVTGFLGKQSATGVA